MPVATNLRIHLTFDTVALGARRHYLTMNGSPPLWSFPRREQWLKGWMELTWVWEDGSIGNGMQGMWKGNWQSVWGFGLDVPQVPLRVLFIMSSEDWKDRQEATLSRMWYPASNEVQGCVMRHSRQWPF